MSERTINAIALIATIIIGWLITIGLVTVMNESDLKLPRAPIDITK